MEDESYSIPETKSALTELNQQSVPVAGKITHLDNYSNLDKFVKEQPQLNPVDRH